LDYSDQLRDHHRDAWHRATHHPFIEELGSGTLPLEKFRRYFLQDYVFVNDLARMSGIAIGSAPDLPSARPIHQFLTNLMGAEDALFIDAFKALDVPEETFRNASPDPVTAAFGDFLVRLAYQGSFPEICAALLVTEGVYMDWGERLSRAGAAPGNPMYQGWIDIHTEDVLGSFVSFLSKVVNDASGDERSRSPIERVFGRALDFEVKFWDVSYAGSGA
jgi:thiaminase/transcriptional activator TenA